MHELSLAESLVSQLEDAARREGALKITRIDLELGAMSGVEREPFEFAFPVVSEGTMAQGATLVFHEVPVRVRCAACAAESSPEPPVLVCERCGDPAVAVVAGRDFKVKSMEVNDDV